MSANDPFFAKDQTNLEVYTSHSPNDFDEALEEINSYCKRQLPIELNTVFSPTCFDITLDENYAVICGEYGNVANFELATNKILRDEEIFPEVPITNVCLVVNDKQVILASASHELAFLDYPSFDVLYRYHLQQGPIVLNSYRQNLELIISNHTNELKRVKLSTEDDFYTDHFSMTGKSWKERIIDFSLDASGTMAVIGFENGVVGVVSYYDFNGLFESEAHPSPVTKVIISSSGTLVAASYADLTAKLFEVKKGLHLKFSECKHTELITGLAFARQDKYLVSSSLDNYIQVADTIIESTPYSVFLYNSPIRMMKSCKSSQTVFYIQDPNRFMIWKVPQIPQNARYRKHKNKIIKVLFVHSSYELISISDDGEINLWDFRCHELIFSMDLNQTLVDAKLVFTSRSLLISTNTSALYLVNLDNQSVQLYETTFSILSFSISDSEKTIAVSDKFSRVVLHSFPEMEKQMYLKGHLDIVNGSIFVSQDKVLITASKDTTLGIWEIDTGTRLVKMQGHSSEVLNILSSRQGYILSGDIQGTIIVWSKEGFLLYHLVPPESEPILRIYLSYYNDYLITLQPSSVNYWQMNNLSLIFQKSTQHHASSLAVSTDEKHIAIAEGPTVFIEENSLECNSLHITGKTVGSMHCFMKFLIDSQTQDSKAPYEMVHNHWLIAPYLIGPAHILAYSNRFSDLQRALFFEGNKANFFSSVKNETPLNICVSKEFKNCIDICLRYIKQEGQGRHGKPRNPRAFIPLESCLNELNQIEYSYISKLYDSLFIENHDPYLPRFCKIELDLPKWDPCEQFNIFSDKFYPHDMFPSTGRPVVFQQSVIPLSLDTGTSDSIDFMESLLNCPDNTIFRSKIIIEYLQYKWSLLKKPTYLIGLVYILYLIMLGLHIVVFLESKFFLFLLILIHVVLVSWEVLQIATDFGDYWKNAWNVLDQLRSISFSFYAIMAWGGDYNTDILLSVLIFSWTRGIGCFRMFDETRYMVRLIVQVIIDITTFFFILFYATLAFAFVYYMRNPEKSFAVYLTVAYRLDLGDFETDLHSAFDWGIFFVATMINPLIMLNLLIAIMSDTASYVDTVDDILGYRELAQMIIEVEKVMFWKKHLKHKHFLHKLDYFAVSDEEVDKKAIKIALIKKQVVRNYDEVKRLDRITKEINQAQVQEKVEKFAAGIHEVRDGLGNGFREMEGLVTRIKEGLRIKE